MKRQTLRKSLMAVLAVALLTSGGYAIQMSLDFQREAEIYETAQQNFVTIVEEEVPLAQLPTVSITTNPSYVVPVDETATVEIQMEETVEEPAPQEVVPLANPLEPGITVNFDGLTALNPDVVAWIHIPNSTISYPVLQGEDNQTYLDTTYDGQYSVVGSIFADYRISGDFSQQNTILYGHNVSSGTMFGSLKEYRSASYTQEHPYFFLLTQEGYLGYEVCYVLVTSATAPVYDFDFSQEGSFADHLAMLEGQTLYQTGVEVTQDNRLVTLSTCTGVTQEERLVVIGRLDTERSSG